LLSDCANIQVVATFNTDILNIDEALLRKGRLIAKYEFKELEEDKVKLLAEKIGVNISGKQKLSDIYNCNDISFSKKATEIGFSELPLP
jgi:ATP-dependent 26S proteasome regulatory subunit